MFLKPMTDFVLEQNIIQNYIADFEKLTVQYAKLFKQKPNLGMFIPCDENGNVLKEVFPDFDGTNQIYYNNYQSAVKRVLFKGFMLSEKKLSVQSFREKGTLRMQIPIKDILNFETVEDMVNHFINPLELTEEAAKKYYNL